jgi:hypothetical protein
MNFILKNGMTGKNNYKPSLRDINKAIDSLDPEALNPFVILEPSEEINGSKFIQVLCYYDSDIKTGSYRIEIQISDGDSFKQYKYFTPVKSEIKKYFEDYFINALSPDITHWTDFTAEVLNEKSMRDIFNVYDLAETHSRKDKKIFGGYNLYHSGIIKGETEDAVVFSVNGGSSYFIIGTFELSVFCWRYSLFRR